MSSVWDNEYSLSVLSKLSKAFMRYRGNNICPDKQINKCGGRTARKHNAFSDTVRWQKHINIKM